MDFVDDDNEPFDIRDVDDADDFDEDELEDATEDDVDLVIGAYREDGQATVVAMDFDLANDFDELLLQLRRFPGDHGVFGFVSVAGEFFVVAHVRGREVKVVLSDATAANDWPIARDVVDYLGEDIPDEDDDPFAVGDFDMLSTFGISAFELENIANDDEDSDESVSTIAAKLKLEREFEAAAAEFDV